MNHLLKTCLCCSAIFFQTAYGFTDQDMSDNHSKYRSNTVTPPGTQLPTHSGTSAETNQGNNHEGSSSDDNDENSNTNYQNNSERRNSDETESTSSRRHFIFKNTPHFRAAARLGVDETRIDAHRPFLSGGIEASWIDRQTSLRPEVGARLSTSIDGVTINGAKVKRVSNIYGFVGVGATMTGLVGGLRFLVGDEMINIGDNYPSHNLFSLGGEARVGYEWGRGLSAFASYGLTEHMQLVAMDLGVSF